jgi:hypothetical protein
MPELEIPVAPAPVAATPLPVAPASAPEGDNALDTPAVKIMFDKRKEAFNKKIADLDGKAEKSKKAPEIKAPEVKPLAAPVAPESILETKEDETVKAPEKVAEPPVITAEALNDLVKQVTHGNFATLDALINDHNLTKAKAAKLKDKFIEDAADYYEKTGNLTPYLEAKAVDYDKTSPEDLIRKELREKNPEYSEKAFEKVFAKEMKQYEVDEDAEEGDKEFAKEELTIRANRIRKELKERQAKFTPPPIDPDLAKREQEASLAQYNTWKSGIEASDPVKALISTKKLAYKVGDANVEVDVSDPAKIISTMVAVNPVDLFKALRNTDGTVNLPHALSVYDHAFNPNYANDLITKGIALGRAQFEGEIKNTSNGRPIQGRAPEPDNSKDSEGKKWFSALKERKAAMA